MLVIHATKKLLDRVGKATVEPTTPSSTQLGSWYATVLFWRPQVALFVNEPTLLPVLMPLAPSASVLERFTAWLVRTLEAHAVPRPFIDAELAEASEIGLAKTNNRSVLGVMNELAGLADRRRDEIAIGGATLVHQVCPPTSLAQDGAAGLGGQAGKQQLTEVLTHPGFSQVLEVRP